VISGDQSEGLVAVYVVGAAIEPSYCSPDVSQRELRELENGFAERPYYFMIYESDMM
jgi:hypothetical protein